MREPEGLGKLSWLAFLPELVNSRWSAWRGMSFGSDEKVLWRALGGESDRSKGLSAGADCGPLRDSAGDTASVSGRVMGVRGTL